jgi:hypothetical protein
VSNFDIDARFFISGLLVPEMFEWSDVTNDVRLELLCSFLGLLPNISLAMVDEQTRTGVLPCLKSFPKRKEAIVCVSAAGNLNSPFDQVGEAVSDPVDQKVCHQALRIWQGTYPDQLR